MAPRKASRPETRKGRPAVQAGRPSKCARGSDISILTEKTLQVQFLRRFGLSAVRADLIAALAFQGTGNV